MVYEPLYHDVQKWRAYAWFFGPFCFYCSLVFYVLGAFFNKTIIPLAFVGCQMIIATGVQEDGGEERSGGRGRGLEDATITSSISLSPCLRTDFLVISFIGNTMYMHASIHCFYSWHCFFNCTNLETLEYYSYMVKRIFFFFSRPHSCSSYWRWELI